MARWYPGKRVEIKRSPAKGNVVVLHCHQVWPGGLEYAGIDISRLDVAGKNVGHWDVLQEMPKVSAHQNGIFLQSGIDLRRSGQVRTCSDSRGCSGSER